MGTKIVRGNLQVDGTFTTQSMAISGDIIRSGDETVLGDLTVGGALTVDGNSVLTTADVDAALSGTSENPVQNKVVKGALDEKQATLVSGTNIKTINSQSLLGSGDIVIQAGVTSVGGATGAITLGTGLSISGNEISAEEIDIDAAMSSTSENPVQNKVITVALGGKVDKETGKGLSANDFTTAYKDNVDANTTARHTHPNKSILDATTASYTTAEQTKLGGVAAGAQVNVLEGVQVNGTDLTITNKKVNVDLSSFITKNVDDLVNYYTKSLTYSKSEVNDLLNAIKTIEIVIVESLPATGESNKIYLMAHSHGTGDIYDEYVWVSSTSSYEKIGNTDIDLSAYSTTAQMNAAIASALTSYYTKTQIDTTLASYYTKTEVDTALGGKVDKVTGKGLSTNDYTTAEKNKLEGIEAGAQVNAVTSVAGKTGAVTLAKADISGLNNVDNTSDLDKPISTATQTALDAKQATLVSGTNIKTVGGNSLLGSGNIAFPADTNQKVKAGTTTFGNDATVNFVGGGITTVTGDSTNNAITISTPAYTGGTGINISGQTINCNVSDTNQKVKVGTTTFGANDEVNFVGSGAATVTGNATDKAITVSVDKVIISGTAYTATYSNGVLAFTIPS